MVSRRAQVTTSASSIGATSAVSAGSLRITDVSVTWTHPASSVLYGFSTAASASYGFYETLSGGDESFSRVDVRWTAALGLDPRFGTVRFVSHFLWSDPQAGNKVPFYLQPTLGGADIADENLLAA